MSSLGLTFIIGTITFFSKNGRTLVIMVNAVEAVISDPSTVAVISIL